DRVVSVVAIEMVVAVSSVDLIISGAAAEVVALIAAGEGVISAAAGDAGDSSAESVVFAGRAIIIHAVERDIYCCGMIGVINERGIIGGKRSIVACLEKIGSRTSAKQIETRSTT